MNNSTVNKLDKHHLSEVMKVKIPIKTTNRNCVTSDRIQRKEHRIMSVIFLSKIHKLIFFFCKETSTNSNGGYSKKQPAYILKYEGQG